MNLILKRTHFYRPKTNKRIEQVYVESIYRYYMTPYVLTGAISVNKAIDMWLAMQRKVMRVPIGVTREL